MDATCADFILLDSRKCSRSIAVWLSAEFVDRVRDRAMDIKVRITRIPFPTATAEADVQVGLTFFSPIVCVLQPIST